MCICSVHLWLPLSHDLSVKYMHTYTDVHVLTRKQLVAEPDVPQMRLNVSKNIISGRRNSLIRHFLILEVQSDTAILMGGHRQGTNILHLEVPICNFLETLQNLGNAFCNGNAGTLLCTSTLYHVSVPNSVFDHHFYQYHQVHSIDLHVFTMHRCTLYYELK